MVEAERLEPDSFIRSMLAHEDTKFMQKLDFEVGKDPSEDFFSEEDIDDSSD